jgi:hypothetical protein
MRILVCGHSFIRRYREYLEEYNLYIDNGRGLSDFSLNIGLDNTHEVYVSGRGGLCANIGGCQFILDEVRHYRPHVIVLEIGTNDLASGVSARTAASNVLELTGDLFRLPAVRVIVSCQVVKRRRARGDFNPHSFDAVRLDFNARLQREARRNRHLYMYRHDRIVTGPRHRYQGYGTGISY